MINLDEMEEVTLLHINWCKEDLVNRLFIM